MVGFYERRKSRAAIWCLRLAVISVPFLILTIFLHRSASITTPQAFWLIAVAIAMLLGSLLFGVRAALDLWERGYKGGQATVNGIVLASLMLIPFGIQLFKALENPQLSDVATDVLNPPRLIELAGGVSPRGVDEPVYDEFSSRLIVASYPELVARRYNAPPERVAQSVIELLDRWNWRIRASANLPRSVVEQPAPETGSDIEENAEGEAPGAAEAEEETQEPLAGDQSELEELQLDGLGEGRSADIVVQATARSFVLRLPSHLVIRLMPEGESTIVDMRSFSTWGRHDFGSNADNISGFLEALDESLAGIAGEG